MRTPDSPWVNASRPGSVYSSWVRFFPLLLRALLILTLVANGVGAAQAAVRMHASHQLAMGTAVASPADDAVSSGCHESSKSATRAAPSGHVGMGHSDAAASDAGAQDMSCCDGGACDCVCAQHLSGLRVSFTEIGWSLERSATHRWTLTERASPQLAHPIRPPIG